MKWTKAKFCFLSQTLLKRVKVQFLHTLCGCKNSLICGVLAIEIILVSQKCCMFSYCTLYIGCIKMYNAQKSERPQKSRKRQKRDEEVVRKKPGEDSHSNTFALWAGSAEAVDFAGSRGSQAGDFSRQIQTAQAPLRDAKREKKKEKKEEPKWWEREKNLVLV